MSTLETSNTKVCTRCHKDKLLSEFHVDKNSACGFYTYCRQCCSEQRKKVYYEDISKARAIRRKSYYNIVDKTHTRITKKRRLLWKRYRLNMGEYAKLIKSQHNSCAICGTVFGNINTTQKPFAYVDHDHSTGKVRGLLCGSCNLGIGNMKENIYYLHNAVMYLEKHKERNV